jgi:hypothetical protein
MIRDTLHRSPESLPDESKSQRLGLVQQLCDLFAEAESLVTRSADAIVYFERTLASAKNAGELGLTLIPNKTCATRTLPYLSSLLSNPNPKTSDPSLRQEMKKLLQANSCLSIDLKQVTLEFRHEFLPQVISGERQRDLSNKFLRTDNDEVKSHASNRGGFNPSPPNLKTAFSSSASENKSTGKPNGSLPLYSSSSMTYATETPALNMSTLYSPGTVPQMAGSTAAISQSQFRQQSQSPALASASAYKSTPASRVQEPRTGASLASRGSQLPRSPEAVLLQDPMPFRRMDVTKSTSIPEESSLSKHLGTSYDFRSKSANFQSSVTPGTDFERTGVEQSEYLGSYGTTLFKQSNQFGIGSLVSTPNQQAATASVSRLTKIGTDLDFLTSKLDDIDKRKSKVITRILQKTS